MKTDIIELNIRTVLTSTNAAMGWLYVYRVLDGSEVEIDVDIEFDYQPKEKQTETDPGCDEEVAITRVVDSSTGQIEYDLNEIGNLDFAEEDILVPIGEE